ncbi:HupE/UreJ family protein [bacterium]|jgi:hypothetical protein|nr:HupE/UreJ family protein [bacterium]
MLKKFLLIICLSPTTQAFAHGISKANQVTMLNGGYLEYIRLGAIHMVTGYDHLLFLLGIIFFLRRFKDIFKFITAFTLGHSITLIFATIFNVSANYYLVDAIIALSVCYKGFENIDGFKKYLKIKSPNLISIVFLFGLIHGFGLSTRLQQLPLGDHGLVMRILSFNVGVEIGQIVALLAMIILISNWRKTPSFTKFSTFANGGLIVAGALLFLIQIHGFLNTPSPDNVRLRSDNHSHAHEEINTQKTHHHGHKAHSH